MFSFIASFMQDPLFNVAASVVAVSSAFSPGFYTSAQDNANRAVGDIQALIGTISSSNDLFFLSSTSSPYIVNPGDGVFFGYEDIKSVNKQFIDSNVAIGDDEFTRYTIVLKSGVTKYVDVPGEALYEMTVRRFRDVGYTGSIELIMNFNESPVKPTPTGTLTITPASGAAPLSVSITFERGSSCSPYSISWGDGTTTIEGGGNTAVSCAQVVVNETIKHTYTKAGTYTVRLQQGDTVKTGTVKVTSDSSSTGNEKLTATPSAPAVNQSVRFTFTAPQMGEYEIDFGDGTSATEFQWAIADCPLANTGCKGFASAQTAHTYTKAGTYTVVLAKRSTCTGTSAISCTALYSAEVDRITITVGGSGNTDTLMVAPKSGAAPLTVTATFDRGSSCSAYTINWGDGTNTKVENNSALLACAQVVVKDFKVSHTYTKAGTYTITLTQGNTTKSATVTVTDGNGSGSIDGLPYFETVEVKANPTNISAGDSSTITWNAREAGSCTGFGKKLAKSGSARVSPGKTTTYTVTCTGGELGNTSATGQVEVKVSGTQTNNNAIGDYASPWYQAWWKKVTGQSSGNGDVQIISGEQKETKSTGVRAIGDYASGWLQSLFGRSSNESSKNDSRSDQSSAAIGDYRSLQQQSTQENTTDSGVTKKQGDQYYGTLPETSGDSQSTEAARASFPGINE